METTNEVSEISVQPRNHFVIVKASTKISVSSLMLSGGKINDSDANERVKFTIAGIGNKVDSLSIGDEVIINGAPDQTIFVKENNKSKLSLMNFYKDVFKDNRTTQELIKTSPKLDLEEYLLYPEFSIVAIVK